MKLDYSTLLFKNCDGKIFSKQRLNDRKDGGTKIREYSNDIQKIYFGQSTPKKKKSFNL